MNDTLTLLKPLVDDTLKDMSLETLAVLYQKNADSKILATAYMKIYKLAITIKNQYWGLTEADMVSLCLERLDFALRHYEVRPNRKTKFATYFYKLYSNDLRKETEALNYKKRKCILESINELINVGVEDTYNLIEMLLPNTLTEREYKLCIMESQGYDRGYIADVLNVSRMTVHNIEKSLQSKLSDLRID